MGVHIYSCISSLPTSCRLTEKKKLNRIEARAQPKRRPRLIHHLSALSLVYKNKNSTISTPYTFLTFSPLPQSPSLSPLVSISHLRFAPVFRQKLSAKQKSSTNMSLPLGITADMHIHLRQGAMAEIVAPTVREGGISVAYIMPNLTPPITSIEQVTEYKRELERLAPKTNFFMTFYLCKQLTPQLVEDAAKIGAIRGIKCYPAGVTTNSSAGVDPNDFSDFYPIFKVMQENNLVLNLHGEKPSTEIENEEEIHVLNAEPRFLPALQRLHEDFPHLKIVLEHCTTKAAIEMVEKINESVVDSKDVKVAASITAHHLSLTIDDWAGNPINFCKPVAKLPSDKYALIKAATSGKPYFFFGSDSAPHPITSKARHQGVCAGVYTQSHALAYLAEVFEARGKLEALKSFVSDFPLGFYEIADLKNRDIVTLMRRENKVPEFITEGNISIAPFKAGETLQWTPVWSEH